MNRPWTSAVVFVASVGVLVGVMGWVTHTVLRLDRAQRQASMEAALEEAVRLALWRMDSVMAPLIAQESARPWTYYVRATTSEIERPEWIVLYFQMDSERTVVSPEVLGGRVAKGSAAGQDPQAFARLEALRASLSHAPLAPLLPDVASQPAEAVQIAGLPAQQAEQLPVQQELQIGQGLAAPVQPQGAQQQQQRSATEFQKRVQSYQQVIAANTANIRTWAAGEASIGLLRCVWVDGKLLLARRVRAGGEQYVQGAWLDWDRLRTMLTGEVNDLLLGASLQPVRSPSDIRPGRMLAVLPARLEAAGLANVPPLPRTPATTPLVVAWLCVLLAAGAIGALLWGAVTLSERRAAFVSAVTHELRTPLTTLRMYAEMLQEGMIPDPAKRQSYLQTMRAEADRLGHLVENVLSYSRIERGRARGHIETIRLPDLLERVRPRLEERTRQAGMELVVSGGGSTVSVRADASATEQILFNLVDNACKYAARSQNRRIEVTARDRGAEPGVCVRDHGPGLSPDQQRRLFRPFSKSAGEAAQSAPGVGLGLALSRRLAREMGGDLRLIAEEGEGACFLLTLPPA